MNLNNVQLVSLQNIWHGNGKVVQLTVSSVKGIKAVTSSDDTVVSGTAFLYQWAYWFYFFKTEIMYSSVLVQDSSANALELLQSCTKPLIWPCVELILQTGGALITPSP